MFRFYCAKGGCGAAFLLGSVAAYPVAAQAQLSLAGPINSITLTNRSGAAVVNYPLQFGRPFLDGAISDEPQVLIGGTPVKTQADIKNRYPDGSVEYAVVAVMVPTVPASGSLTLTFQNQTAANNTPLTRTQMLSMSYMFSAQLILVGTGGGTAQSVDARTMLANGDYKLWTSGPVAQTIILADDTASRKYDIGLGDGYHPFRPRFEATFWPATHQVFVRAIGENGLSTELEDLHYALTITGANAKIYKNAALTQGAMQTWTKSFWLGGTPRPQVDIDNNLAYLESTRWVPNYDPSLSLSQATLASDYANWWVNTSHDLNGAGAWNPGMASPGARPDIGPEPSWDVAWLYSGDWRLRAAALGNADLAAAWPVNLRESAAGYRLNRADAAGSSTGLGYPVALTDRPDVGPNGTEGGGLGDFLYYNSCEGCAVADALKVVGALDTTTRFDYASSHEPSPFFIPYVLTGDPFYLEEMENWAAYDAFANQKGQRGPTGVEGGLADNELRGDGWILRSRAEAAFAIPDGDPFKTYLSILTQEDIAAWEGALGVTDPVLSSTSEYQWAKGYGDPESATNFGHPAPAPALGQWAASLPTGTSPTDFQGQMASGNATAYTENFMNWYVVYSVGRAAELGFAAKPLALYSGAYLTGLINGPDPQLIASYFMPSMLTTGQITSFPALIASLSPAWLTGAGYTGPSGNALPQQFSASLYNQGYEAYALAALSPLVDDGAAGAAQAETWMRANVYQPLVASGSLAADPSWAILPRTDKNALPAQPVTGSAAP